MTVKEEIAEIFDDLQEELKELEKIAESQGLTIGAYLKQEAQKILTEK